jgi:hypothetical protein
LNFQRTAACVTAQGELHFDKAPCSVGRIYHVCDVISTTIFGRAMACGDSLIRKAECSHFFPSYILHFVGFTSIAMRRRKVPGMFF